MFDVLNDLLSMVVGTFTNIFNSLSTDILEFMEAHENVFSRFLIGVMEFTGLDNLLEGVTLAGFIFGNFMLAIVVFLIIYVFIP